MLMDLLRLLFACIPVSLAKDPLRFWLLALTGVGLAALGWIVCAIYTRLWNNQFHLTALHQVFCVFAGVCTLLFAILFASVLFVEDAANASIFLWQKQLKADSAWSQQTFRKAYNNVKDLGVEDFSNVPAPDAGGNFFPTTYDESRETAAPTYAQSACDHFSESHRFLSKVVWSSPGVPADVVFNDVKIWQQKSPMYPAERGIELAGEQIRLELAPQTPRLVLITRIVLVVLFLLVQAIPFGLVGWAAFSDIRARF
ncbi:MAG: hypothetical protein ABSG96_13790 [Terracidiphilus sp.]